MAYNQQFDFGTGPVPSVSRPRAYADNRQYRNERHDYRERPTNVQQYDNHEYDSMQQPQHYNYHEEEEYGRGGGYDRNEYDQPPNHKYRGHRSPPIQSPPLQYDERGYDGQAHGPPTQQSRHRNYDQANHRARNGPPPPQSQYPQDRSREPKHAQQHQGSRPQRNGVSGQARDDYQMNGNERRDHYGDTRPEFLEQESYSFHDDWQQQSHRPGRSNGYEEQGHNDRNGARGAGRDFTSQSPVHDQQRSRSNGRPKVDKRQIFGDPTPPNTVAWDNPFPTFPAGKKRALHDGKSLNGSMEDVHIHDNNQRALGSRPHTADGRDQNGREGQQPRSQQSNWDMSGVAKATAGFREAPAEASGNAYGHSNRPRPSTGRRSEDNARIAPRTTNGAFYPDSDRSKTMPEKISSAVSRSGFQQQHNSPSEWPGTGPTGDYAEPQHQVYAPDRPSAASGSGPFGAEQQRSNETSRSREYQSRSTQSNGIASMQSKRERPPASRQDSIAEVYDSYYHGSTPASPDHRDYRAYRPPTHEEMPNFNVEPVSSPGHHRGSSIDDHLQPQKSSRDMAPVPDLYRSQHPAAFDRSQAHGQVPRSKSQPDLKSRRPPKPPPNDGFDFGLPPDSSAPPPDPYRPNANRPPRQLPSDRSPAGPNYGPQYGALGENSRHPPAPYRSNGAPRSTDTSSEQNVAQAPPDQYRPPARDRPSPNGQMRGPGIIPSPDVRAGPTSIPANVPVKPDALPAHPAPVRAGLMSSPSPNQPPKPVPVRNYNSNSSPLQNYGPTQPPSGSQPVEQPRAPAPVSQTELDNLRQKTKSNPSDQGTQMALAKKLVEAAAGLDNGVPRMDQKTIQKTRERYYAEAYKNVKRLVSTGNADAMFFLGDSFSQGRLGLERDSKEAFTLYQSAAKAGHAQAAFRVAVCCELGLEEDGGTKRDLGKAVQWYQRAAQLGDTPATYKTGVIKLKGLLGQPKDTGDAVVWLRRAAEKADKDNPHALHELALWHEGASANGKIAGDEAYGRQMFQQAADLGYKFSQYRLGRAYEYGMLGCPIDPRQSIAWYSKAAMQEEHQSELALSGWYLTGSEGVLQQSDTEAYLWARKAATAGLAKAEFAMGYFTEVGIGCPPSSEEAKRWYWRAASQSFPKARERLEELRKGGAKMKKERVSRSAMKQESECSVM